MSFEGIFPKSNPLASATAEEVLPAIAAALDIPPAHPLPAQVPTGATQPPMTPKDAARITGELLDGCRVWIRRYTIVTEEQAVIMAAWILHTYAFDAAETTPYIHITAPEKACGKSRLMETLAAIAANPMLSGGMTAAALVRSIDLKKPTIFLDEMDAQLGGDKEYAEAIRGILNVGFQKGGTFSKCDGKNHDLKEFNAYSPKCFAGIGNLPDTVASRSIAIEMRRKLTGEAVEPFRRRSVKAAAMPIKMELDAWKMRGAANPLERIQPAPIAGLSDRQNDIAEPLLCIAHLAGDGWPQRLTAALQMVFKSTSAEDSSIGATLLVDIRTLFDERKSDEIPSRDVVECLCEIEGRPWAEWNHGKPMSANNLARQLKKHHIHTAKIRFACGPAQGYRRRDFEEVWSRYCPARSIQPEQPEQPASLFKETASSKPEQKRNTTGTPSSTVSAQVDLFHPVPVSGPIVPVVKSASNPHEQRSVPVVPVQRGDADESEVRI